MFLIQLTEAEFEHFESHSFSSKIIFKQAVEDLVRTILQNNTFLSPDQCGQRDEG